MEYLFITGRTSKLCQAELEAVLKTQKISYQLLFSSPEIFHLKTKNPLDADKLMRILGGTIKIAEVEKKLLLNEDEQLRDEIITLLLRSNRVKQEKITFGLSGYGDFSLGDLNHYSRMIKEELVKKGIAARFILPKEGTVISSVVVLKQEILEIILVQEKDEMILAKTLAVSDFEDWNKRDFGRPCSDSHAGMLPPKVARMMVNLASPAQSYAVAGGQKPIVLDPFCGVGTILMEAMMLGYPVIGTDISETAVEKTEKNLQWLVSKFKVQPFDFTQGKSSKFKVFQMDATHVSEKMAAGSVDAIVTEPYLGPSNVMLNSFQHPQRILNQVQDDKIHNIILGLDKLYLGCLREWRKILKPGGMVVMAFPSFMFNKQEFFVKKALDTCESLGYTLVGGPYEYARPQAVVRRNIYILKFKGLKV